MIKRTNDERDEDHDREIAILSEIMLTRTADEWEEFLQARHVPAARVRTMGEALADPRLFSDFAAARSALRYPRGNRRRSNHGQVHLGPHPFANRQSRSDRPVV